MKASPRTVLVALEEVLCAAGHVSEDAWIQWKVLGRVLGDLAEAADTELSDTELIHLSLATAYKALGVTDPYENEKARLNKMLLSLEEQIQALLAEQPSPLRAALRAALAGSCFDFRTVKRDAFLPALRATLDRKNPRDDGEQLAAALNHAESVLYFLGGAGEIVLDKILIAHLARKARVTVVAHSDPILTEATAEDCLMAGLDKIPNVSIIDTGMSMLGIWLERTRKEVRELFESADLVVSKGVHNAATLLGEDREIYFITPARGKALRDVFSVAEGEGVIARCQGCPAAEKE